MNQHYETADILDGAADVIAPERTKQEVLDALRLAAKNERRLADGTL